MTAKTGRLEATITVPFGGWDAEVAIATVGTFTMTIPAGDYYFSELIEELEDQLNAGPGSTWDVSILQGEPGSGPDDRVRIIYVTHAYTITWTDTDLRDVLGHSGNIDNASGAFAPLAPIGVWRPDCPKWTPYGDAVYDTISDLAQAIGPSGGVKTLVSNSFEALEGVSWSHVSNAKAIGTSTAGSWQHFWRVAMLGAVSYIKPGDTIALFWDADSSAFDEVQLVVPNTSQVQPAINGWTGLYGVTLPMIVKV